MRNTEANPCVGGSDDFKGCRWFSSAKEHHCQVPSWFDAWFWKQAIGRDGPDGTCLKVVCLGFPRWWIWIPEGRNPLLWMSLHFSEAERTWNMKSLFEFIPIFEITLKAHSRKQNRFIHGSNLGGLKLIKHDVAWEDSWVHGWKFSRHALKVLSCFFPRKRAEYDQRDLSDIWHICQDFPFNLPKLTSR